MRWLGIDHGSKRIGVAVGSTSDGVATPVTVLSAEPLERALADIAQLRDQYGADGIVVGWPLNMDDTEGAQGRTARQAAVAIASALDCDVRLWDERLSSFEADQRLAGTMTRKQKKARQDAVAAAAMLQDFLSAGGPDAAPRPEMAD